MAHYVIIVAGGSGSRMENDTPKQLLPLQGKPLLMHTLQAFHHSRRKPKIILVLKEGTRHTWEALCHEYDFKIPHHIITGGNTRFHSVKKGLQAIFNKESELKNTWIAIHDAVRPLVSDLLIEKLFALAEEKQSAIPFIRSSDTLRIKYSDGAYKTIPREDVILIQTPQIFHATTLQVAFKQEYQERFTDDATVVENSGYPLHFTSGDIRNIKITYPNDLNLAEYWLTRRED